MVRRRTAAALVLVLCAAELAVANTHLDSAGRLARRYAHVKRQDHSASADTSKPASADAAAQKPADSSKDTPAFAAVQPADGTAAGSGAGSGDPTTPKSPAESPNSGNSGNSGNGDLIGALLGGNGASNSNNNPTPANTAPAATNPTAPTNPSNTPASSAPANTPSTPAHASQSASTTPKYAVVTSTSYSTPPVPPISAPSGSSTASQDKDNGGGSSGISRATLIPIIVVASCVAAVAAIWTIVRKVKFSPSKRFESKLEPIDYSPGAVDDKMSERAASPFVAPRMGGHDRNLSIQSGGRYGEGYAQSLSRSDSDGSRSLRQPPMADPSFIPGSVPYHGGAMYGQQAGYDYYNSAPSVPYQGPVGFRPETPQMYSYAELQRGGSARSNQGAHGYTGHPY